MATEGPIAESIAAVARRFRQGELSPVELLEAYLRRIERLNPRLNAFVTIDEPGARQAARESERRLRNGEARSPLEGIPVGFKDIFYVKGMRTTAGSKIFADFVPEFDATAVARLKEAGAVVVGMTNTHEFASGTTTENPHYGPTRNPWDLGRVPGGSSGGSGAAVAASLCLAAMGSDTGGSIRIPASLCGIVGLKPTYGRVSRWGVFPVSWSLDHVGPMTRTVEDAALMLEVLAARDPHDPATVDGPEEAFSKALTGDIAGLRVGVPTHYFFERVAPEVESVVRAAIARLEALGAHAVELDWPDPEDAERVVAVTSLILVTEAAAFHEPYIRSRGGEYGEDVYERLDWGRQVLASEYLQAQRLRTLLGRRLAEVFQQVDVIVTPTCPVTAFPIGTGEISLGGKTERAQMTLVRLTRLANMMGWPAISVPCGFDNRSLPVGLQVMGRPFDEATVLKVAHAYEEARGPLPEPPPVE